MKKLGEIWNQNHHAHPLVLCDSKAVYGGWPEHEDTVIDGGTLELGGLAAVIVDNGSHQHVDVYEEGDELIFVNARKDPEALAAAPRDGLEEVGHVDVPSGVLTVAIAYIALNKADAEPGYDKHASDEIAQLPVRAQAYTVHNECSATASRTILTPRA